MVVEVIGTSPGRRGTGRFLEELDGDDIYDLTTDGTSTWLNAIGQGRLIRNETKHEWAVVS